jgi:hypothetical protein
LATISTPMMLFAPGRLSMITFCASAFDTSCMTMRVATSVIPPGV